MEKFRERLLAFINSPKDVPVLAGFSVGFYMLLFYYAANYSLANSFIQFAFFTGYYLLLPIITIVAGANLLKIFGFGYLQKHFIFVAIIGFFSYYLIQLSSLGPQKKIIFAGIFLLTLIVTKPLSRYYKALIPLLLFISVFNIFPLLTIFFEVAKSSSEWKEQPDAIESVIFKERPNIYYIQPDGYTNSNNLAENPYNFDNSTFESFLDANQFKLYKDYRSNYISTLLSNSSMFSMKHHYSATSIDLHSARGIIVGDNSVLKILKSNNYKTHFITEKPYLVINRPAMGYDYCNVNYADLPYLKDGWSVDLPITEDFKKLPIGNGDGNFYFLEKMSPNHIEGFKSNSAGIEGERQKYLQRLKNTNAWLEDIINHINSKDPGALIIIAADHGGYAGFEYTAEAYRKTESLQLARSIFGANLAIKWNNAGFTKYDQQLKSSVNLFRTIFSYLSKEPKYLNNLQDNSSYIMLKEPRGLYQYFDDRGKHHVKRIDDI